MRKKGEYPYPNYLRLKALEKRPTLKRATQNKKRAHDSFLQPKGEVPYRVEGRRKEKKKAKAKPRMR